VGTHLLIPLDGSELAEAALPYAESIGKALGWHAVLFSVVHRDDDRPLYAPPTPVVETPEAGWRAWDEHEIEGDEALAHERTAAFDAMGPAAQRLQAAGLQVVREVGIGNSRDVIVRRAAAEDIAMVVLASHGRTGLARLFRGSVATGVVDHTRRPTLVVRPFRDAEHRVDLEHGDRLAPDQAEAVRGAIEAAAK
jgi:nucleotide-binding universal stress UspA family protein